jgi:hypothetical protein
MMQEFRSPQGCSKFMTNFTTFSRVRCMKLRATLVQKLRGTCIETFITFFSKIGVWTSVIVILLYIYVDMFDDKI